MVIESSLSSRSTDLAFTADLYARYGIPEYRVVDLATAEVVVHREPGAGGNGLVTRHRAGAQLVPATVDGVTLAVDDLLPWPQMGTSPSSS